MQHNATAQQINNKMRRPAVKLLINAPGVYENTGLEPPAFINVFVPGRFRLIQLMLILSVYVYLVS